MSLKQLINSLSVFTNSEIIGTVSTNKPLTNKQMTKLSQGTRSHNVIIYKCVLYHAIGNKWHRCIIYEVKSLAMFHAKLYMVKMLHT